MSTQKKNITKQNLKINNNLLFFNSDSFNNDIF